ncbi:phosphoenolpyruvate carboxykinase, partial [bacterium]
MLELKKGVDILSAVGGIETIGEARKLIQEKLDDEHQARLAKIKTDGAILKIANAIACCQPDAVYISTGSPEDMQNVRKMSLEKGEEKKLAMKDHTIHYDLAEEQGRIVDRTFYIVNEGEPS